MQVFHLRDDAMRETIFLDDESMVATTEKFWPQGLYRLVATVQTEYGNTPMNLEHAFRVTNHIDEAWQKNSGVLAEPGGQRSTSVGDLVRLDDTLYVCCRTGWKPTNVKL